MLNKALNTRLLSQPWLGILMACWIGAAGCDSSSGSGGAAECGNAICEVGETCATCASDCGACNTPACGDAACNGSETCLTCAADCGGCNLPGCGDSGYWCGGSGGDPSGVLRADSCDVGGGTP